MLRRRNNLVINIRRKEDLCRNGAGFEELSLMLSYLIVKRFLFLVDFLKFYHEWLCVWKSDNVMFQL